MRNWSCVLMKVMLKSRLINSSKKRFLYLWCEIIWGFYLIQVYNYITQLYVEYTVTSNDSISSTLRRLSTKCILPIVFGATHTCLAQQWHAGPDRQQGLDSYRPQHDHICKKREDEKYLSMKSISISISNTSQLYGWHLFSGYIDSILSRWISVHSLCNLYGISFWGEW